MKYIENNWQYEIYQDGDNFLIFLDDFLIAEGLTL